MVAFIRTKLVKTFAFGRSETITALSETAERFNNSAWFWTDDNAKAAELLCEPSLYDEDPAAANAAIDFVLRMSKGDIICRRFGPAELRVVSAEPSVFRIETAFTIIEGDLTKGIVRHALRFNDNRSLTVAQHGPVPLSFRGGFGLQRSPLQGVIGDTALTHDPDSSTVTLSHTSTFYRRSPVPWVPGPVLGALRYTYTISADHPFLTLRVDVLPAPGVVLDDVVLGTALDRLDQVPDVAYRSVAVRTLGKDRMVRDFNRRMGAIHDGAADYTAIIQGASCPGFAYAIHTLLTDGEKLIDVVAREGKRSRLHQLRHMYGMGRVDAAGATVTERRMVTGGGYYDEFGTYTRIMGGAGEGTIDPSMSYDIGAELNAVAVHILFAQRGRYAVPPDAERLAQLTAWYDRHIERFFDFIRPGTPDELDRVFTRGIAFVVLSLDCMVRATGQPRYRVLLAAGTRLILATQSPPTGDEHPHVTFRDGWARHLPFLDNHAACILALARAAWHGDIDCAINDAIHQAIRGIRFYTGTIDAGNGPKVAYDGLAVTSPTKRHLHVDTGFWNYKLGITLRALHATLAAAEGGVLAMTGEQLTQASLRIEMARHQIAGSCRAHGEQLEVLTCYRAGETNSETQPWVGLGLVPVLDRQIVSLAPP